MAEEQTTTVETPEQTGTETPEQQTTDQAQGAFHDYSAMDWRAMPDLAQAVGDPDIKKVLDVYPSAQNFVKDAVGWRSEMSRRVRVPQGEAAPEDWQKFYQQLPGYPEAAQGYTESVQLPSLGQDPEGNELDWDKDLLTTFYESAHQHGLTAPQAQAVLETYARTLAQSQNVTDAMSAQAQADAERELQKRFGASLPRKVGAARNYFMRSLGNGDLGQRIWDKVQSYVNPESGVALGSDPDFVEFYSMQYERFGEPMDLVNDSLFPMAPTTDEIASEKQKALDTTNDPKRSMAEREAAWKRLERLNEQEAQLARSHMR